MSVVRILLSLIYPIIFIVPITLAGLCYTQTKHRECLICGLLFFVFIMDQMVILLTELVPSFAERYDQIFMTVPTWKTMIYVVSIACMLYLFEYRIRTGKIFAKAMLLFLCTFFQMFVPMMQDGALKVWVYYFPPQLYMFIFAFLGIKHMKAHKDELHLKDSPTVDNIYKILIFTLIFTIAIVLEDSYVIFNVDNYTGPETYIYNRNNCEDIFRIILAVFSSRIMLSVLKRNSASSVSSPAEADVGPIFSAASYEESLLQKQNSGNADTDKAEEVCEDSGTAVSSAEVKSGVSEAVRTGKTVDSTAPVSGRDSDKLNLFAEKYQLTEREKHIFELILSGLGNQEISEELTISLGTVKTHTHNIFSKLDVSRRSEAKRLYESFTK